MATRRIETDRYVVEFEDTPEVREEVFECLLKFYGEEIESFDGESMIQSDPVYTEGPPLLAGMADSIFKFRIQWK